MKRKGRLGRELRTVEAMLKIACRDGHCGPGSSELCADCETLRAYAEARLARCPYGEAKPTCASCPIHCYQPRMREEIREAMRYAGPRMLKEHPVLAVRHLLDGRKAAPERPRGASRVAKTSS